MCVLFRLGASIVVNSGFTLPVYEKTFNNPLCFIQYDSKISPNFWDDVSTKITTCTLNVPFVFVLV